MTDSLGERFTEFKHSLDVLPEAEEPPETTLQILGQNRREQDWQRLLFYFLSPGNPHGLNRDLLEHFLVELADQDEVQFSFSRFDLDTIRVATEVQTSNGRRPDAVIWSPENWFICWELKVGSSEGTDQTTDYVDASSFPSINLKKTDVPDESHHYIYLTPVDASPPIADAFTHISWEWVAEELKAFLASSHGACPARTTAQLEDFVSTIQNELTMTDYQESQREKAELYFKYYDEISTAREAFEDQWAVFAENWAPQLIEQLEIDDPVEIPAISDNKFVIKPVGSSDRWILWQGSSDWAGIFKEGWWRQKDDFSNTYSKSDSKNDVRITFFHRLETNRELAAKDNTLKLELWHGTGNGDKFMYEFKDRITDRSEQNAGTIPPSVTVTGKRGNVLTATYDINVRDHEDFFEAYTAALRDAFLDLVIENDTLIPIITDVFEESLEVFEGTGER